VLDFPYLKANPWGMAIWYTSPLFLFLLFKFKRGKYSISSLLTIIALAIPSFIYFGIGFSQYGYRYASDFLPFLLILLLPSLSNKLSKSAIILISIGVIFNCLYMASLWNSYPLFGIIK
jgi:membrane-associated HD superfamily phosphohydrolase